MELYVLPPSPRAQKVLALMAHLGLEADVHAVDYANGQQSSPEFTRLNPNRRQPVLVDGDFVLWESNAILVYLAQMDPMSSLWPTSSRDQAEVLRWLFWDSSHWDPAWDALITERFKKQRFVVRQSGRRTDGLSSTPEPPNLERIAEAERDLSDLAQVLEGHLGSQDWLAAGRVTIADFAIAAFIPIATMVAFDLSHLGAVMSWWKRVRALPSWPSGTSGGVGAA